MKKFLLGLLLCSSAAFGQYMSKDEVLKEYHSQMALEKAPEFKAGPKYEENMKKTVPENEFKPKSSIMKLERMIEAEDLPDYVDLRPYDTSIKSQIGSLCTAYSGVAIIENLINSKGVIPGVDLSEFHAFSYYNVYQMDRFVTSISKNKICDQKEFPNGGKITAACTKNKHAMIINPREIDQAEVLQVLAAKRPVYFGTAVPRGMANCEKVIQNTSVTSGGHAIELTGYIKDKTSGNYLYIIKNSWGSDCGDKGYQYLPTKYCDKTWCYFYDFGKVSSKYDSVVPTPTVVPTVVPTVIPTIIPTPIPTPEPVCKKWKCIWWTFCRKEKCVEWK
jgi:C1A family cysteine protease